MSNIKRAGLIFCLLVIAGCSQTGGGNTNQNTTGNQNTNENGSGESLTAEQSAAVESALTTTESTSAAMAASSYTNDVQQPDEDSGRATAQPACPNVLVSFDAENLQFVFDIDFGDACTPDLYPVTFSGSISGGIDFDDMSVNLFINQLSTGGQSISGDIDFSMAREGQTVTFTVGDLALDASESGSIQGSGSWTVDTQTGLLTIVSLAGTVTDAQENIYQLTIENLEISVSSNSNLIPQSGTVAITFPNDDGLFGDGTTALVITFQDSTPDDGIVLVSVNGSTQFEYQTALLSD